MKNIALIKANVLLLARDHSGPGLCWGWMHLAPPAAARGRGGCCGEEDTREPPAAPTCNFLLGSIPLSLFHDGLPLLKDLTRGLAGPSICYFWILSPALICLPSPASLRPSFGERLQAE